jgi:hypothetical protein
MRGSGIIDISLIANDIVRAAFVNGIVFRYCFPSAQLNPKQGHRSHLLTGCPLSRESRRRLWIEMQSLERAMKFADRYPVTRRIST